MLADLRGRVEDEDAVGIGGQAEFGAGAEHALAVDACLLGHIDATAAGQHRTGQCDRHTLADLDVPGTAHDR